MVMNELERKFLNALCEHYTIDLRQEKQDTTEEGYTCTFELFKAQKRIDIYVVDFYIKTISGVQLVIELDGQESHKTKEQRFRDYNRERYLQKKGIHVVRFMGTEAYLDADKCIDEFNEIMDYWETLFENSILAWEGVSDAHNEIEKMLAREKAVDLKLLKIMLENSFEDRESGVWNGTV